MNLVRRAVRVGVRSCRGGQSVYRFLNTNEHQLHDPLRVIHLL